MQRFLNRIRKLESEYFEGEMIVYVYGGAPFDGWEPLERIIANGHITYRLVINPDRG